MAAVNTYCKIDFFGALLSRISIGNPKDYCKTIGRDQGVGRGWCIVNTYIETRDFLDTQWQSWTHLSPF